jgi:hypothetical protein
MASILRIAAGAAVALVLLPVAGPTEATGSGLYGTVRMGPVKPVCQAGVPCDGPVTKTMLVFSTSGREIGRVRSTAQGTYRIALRPGYYDVRATVRIGLTKLPKPHAIHVRAGHWDKINLFFDTGIR